MPNLIDIPSTLLRCNLYVSRRRTCDSSSQCCKEGSRSSGLVPGSALLPVQQQLGARDIWPGSAKTFPQAEAGQPCTIDGLEISTCSSKELGRRKLMHDKGCFMGGTPDVMALFTNRCLIWRRVILNLISEESAFSSPSLRLSEHDRNTNTQIKFLTCSLSSICKSTALFTGTVP